MKKIPGNTFQPGNSFGRGRPQGSRNKATIALQEMLDGHGESITRKCALLALQGDPTAMRLCMERLIPPRKDRLVKFRLPAVTTTAEVAAAMSTGCGRRAARTRRRSNDRCHSRRQAQGHQNRGT
jgi:hypothetical protein